MNKLLGSLVLLDGTALLVAAAAAPAPRQAVPKGYWTPRLCERKITDAWRRLPGGQSSLERGLPTADGHLFHVEQAICVGGGGQRTCIESPGSRSRHYSRFTVYVRAFFAGVVRSFTLGTHGPGVPAFSVQQTHRSRDKAPPDFYLSNFKLIRTDVSSADFRSVVGAIAATLAQEHNAKGCASPSGG